MSEISIQALSLVSNLWKRIDAKSDKSTTHFRAWTASEEETAGTIVAADLRCRNLQPRSDPLATELQMSEIKVNFCLKKPTEANWFDTR